MTQAAPATVCRPQAQALQTVLRALQAPYAMHGVCSNHHQVRVRPHARARATTSSAARAKIRAVELTAASDKQDASPHDLISRACHLLDRLASLPEVPPATLVSLSISGISLLTCRELASAEVYKLAIAEGGGDTVGHGHNDASSSEVRTLSALAAPSSYAAKVHTPWKPSDAEWGKVWVLLSRSRQCLRTLHMDSMDLTVRARWV